MENVGRLKDFSLSTSFPERPALLYNRVHWDLQLWLCPPPWLDSMCLISDLLVGCGVGRYLGGGFGPAFEQQVALRGFSAGSFSGLCLLHILWPMPGVVTCGILGAIACPPDLLTMSPAKDNDSLHAQTRVGFLSGGRGKRMRDLTPTEFAAQLEEAYARATVALTRAQRLCLIMGSLDMKGRLGLYRVMNCATGDQVGSS